MTIQEAYEKDGWHFDKAGGHVIVGWKNVTLKNRKAGCVIVSSDDIVVHRQSCANHEAFVRMIRDEKYIVKTYKVGNENDSELISLFLHNVLEESSANDVCESLDRIWRYGLVTGGSI